MKVKCHAVTRIFTRGTDSSLFSRTRRPKDQELGTCYDVILAHVKVLSLTLERKGFHGIFIYIGAEKSVSGK